MGRAFCRARVTRVDISGSFNPFTSTSLDRRSGERLAADWAEQAARDPACRFVFSSGTQHLVRREPEPAVAFLGADHPWVAESDRERWALLGWWQGARCVLVDAPQPPTPPPELAFEELRPLLAVLSHEQAAVLSSARALLLWRARHPFCSVCGSATRTRSAGHSLKCTRAECAAEFFPRIDPAVIVLVSDGPKALLGRQASWPKGRYSALAGFVEAGESLEDAVAREVHEECGVRIEACQYFASQPWPFPASIMLGYHAQARQGPLCLDRELEDARWFRLEELQGANPPLLPPRFTIARRLIESWYQRVTGAQLSAKL